MSVVSGVTLLMSCAEDSSEQEIGEDSVCIINTIDAWLNDHGFSSLGRTEQHYAGSKHPQIFACGGGFNYFPEDEFAQYVMSLPWEYPEEVVLIIHPEDGAPRIWKPHHE